MGITEKGVSDERKFSPLPLSSYTQLVQAVYPAARTDRPILNFYRASALSILTRDIDIAILSVRNTLVLYENGLT